jgi:hypothetical protein
MPTTLTEARAALHRLAERQARLKLRVQRGELVSHRAALDLAVSFGRNVRDRLLNAPVRYSSELAAEFGVEPSLLFMGLRDALTAECWDISGAKPEQPPAGGDEPSAKKEGA